MFFNSQRAVQGCTAIFKGRKPLKMGAIRKPRFSDGEAEKAMDGFFSSLPAIARVPDRTSDATIARRARSACAGTSQVSFQ